MRTRADGPSAAVRWLQNSSSATTHFVWPLKAAQWRGEAVPCMREGIQLFPSVTSSRSQRPSEKSTVSPFAAPGGIPKLAQGNRN